MIVKLILACFVSFLCLMGYSAEPKKKEKKAASESLSLSVEIPNTSVKDQHKTGTCWSFASLSFVESELMRLENKEYNLSEMFVVRNVYSQKAQKYVRMHGATNFAAGGEPNDVFDVIEKYGIIPEEVYSGLLVDTSNHIHFEMDEVLKDYVDAIIKNPNRKLTGVWHDGFMGIIDSYLGQAPQTFAYEGHTYTAKSFAESLKIDPNDYVLLSSFSHHPFYNQFIIEIPDNWSWASVYNLPLEEFVQVADNALENGFSMAWAADVSEKGFVFSEGMAVAPKVLYEPESQVEYKKVSKLSKSERNELFFDMENPIEELTVTQENRQEGFNNYTTTDDHAMHLLGKGEDENGKKYYYIKNSWGSDNPENGYMYISEAYFKYKTLTIMLHKDAIPQDVRTKLNI